MICSKCQTVNPESSQLCTNCGQSLQPNQQSVTPSASVPIVESNNIPAQITSDKKPWYATWWGLIILFPFVALPGVIVLWWIGSTPRLSPQSKTRWSLIAGIFFFIASIIIWTAYYYFTGAE